MAAWRSVPSVCRRLLGHSPASQSCTTLAISQKITIHNSSLSLGRDRKSLEVSKNLVAQSSGLFEELAAKRTKDKLTFSSAIEMYIGKEKVYRRGHVEFIYAAMANMEKFGVHRDLSVYKALIEVFPKEKMIPRSVWQVEFMHYPKQQQCAIDLMDQMEDFGVIPDYDFGKRLVKVFGTEAHAFRKYQRIMYWLPKFKNANPYPIPKELPDDDLSLAVLALKRMAVDTKNKITVWNTTEQDPEAKENTFIASAQSVTQQDLIKKHDPKIPLFVEGGYVCWLRHKSTVYFILRADPDLELLKHVKQAEKDQENDSNLFGWTNFWEEEEGGQLMPLHSLHQQDDGTVLAMGITGTRTKDSLVTWIRCLQQENPFLEQLPIVFRLLTPESQIEVIGNKKPESNILITEQN